MEKFGSKSFNKPDEVRKFPHGQIELVNINGGTVARSTYQPGWKWSTSIKPVVKTDSCQVQHFGYLVSGAMRVRMDDGSEFDMHPGEVFSIPAGHDGWVLGNEPAVFVDFGDMHDFVKVH